MLRAALLIALALVYAYSLAGLLGLSGAPICPWSSWGFSAGLFPGSSRDFEDHFVSVIFFGALLLVDLLRFRKRAQL